MDDALPLNRLFQGLPRLRSRVICGAFGFPNCSKREPTHDQLQSWYCANSVVVLYLDVSQQKQDLRTRTSGCYNSSFPVAAGVHPYGPEPTCSPYTNW